MPIDIITILLAIALIITLFVLFSFIIYLRTNNNDNTALSSKNTEINAQELDTSLDTIILNELGT